MNIIDIINKKRKKEELSYDELKYAFLGYLNKEIADYQMSSLLMAICLNGLTERETFDLCDIFIKSGKTFDLSSIEGVKVDKHSTGGVGDKTTLVLVPLVASLGLIFPKISGRGLGHTGGTIDKLESIKGFNVALSEEELFEELKSIGCAITSQTEDLAPLDKVIYALRDVTGTVESIELIAVSIMSKKIALGADKILIDIKVGKGALIKNLKDAKKLSNLMIKIGKKYQKEVRTIISDMNNPLGNNIGNSLEVLEALSVLEGKVSNNFSKLCIELATTLVSMGKGISESLAKKEVINAIKNKAAYNKFLELVSFQGGDITSLKVSQNVEKIYSNKTGTIKSIDALKMGELAMKLGAGRKNKEDKIDYTVGIILEKQVRDRVNKGDVLCTLYTKNDEMIQENILSYYKIV